MTPDLLHIRVERPDHPQVAPLLSELDAYLASLYAPEDNHILDVKALLAPEVCFMVAAIGERLVGCGAVRCMPGELETGGMPYGEIKRMYVDPSVRGRRIAARLLAALETELAGREFGVALLETGRDQVEAVRLYERAGYERRPAFGGYPDNGLSVFYQKRL